MAVIAIEGMKFRAFIGNYSAERELGNEIEVSVKLELIATAAALTDRLDKTVDYEEVYELVKEVISEPMHLLETSVKKITDKISGQYPSVKKIKVRVAKLNPPIRGIVKKVWAEDVWIRDSK